MAMRQGRKDKIDAVERAFAKILDNRPGIRKGELRMHLRERRTGLAIAEQPDGTEDGMPGAEPEQFRADEARGPQNGDSHIHRSYMHRNA
jgi:hypothetical protein